MKRLGTAKVILFAAILLLVLSIILAVVSLFPVATGENQSTVLIDVSFRLSQNEIRRQGLGALHGGENISFTVQCSNAFPKNFSITTYNGLRFSNFTTLNIAYSFTADADYYEAIFFSDSPNASLIHFEVAAQEPKVLFPFSWLAASAKIIFVASLGLAMLVALKLVFSKSTKAIVNNPSLLSLSQTNRRRILALLLLSLVFWFILLAVNTNPLASFENWYTDHARHSYVSSLFLKDGFSIFDEPLGKIASLDNSYYKFVTWPEMPHLYAIGSILLFLPFGSLLQNGFDPVLVYKVEIALFLVFAHICLYFFLNRYLKKEMHPSLKLLGVYIIYVPLVIYSANGMFDAVTFLFSLLALTMFMLERYDYFFLLVAISIFFKYQAGIFLLPLIIVGLLKLFEKNTFSSLLHNKAVIAGAVFAFVSGFTAYLSAPFLMATRPELIMNGINAFSSHSQIPWTLQSFSVLLTLSVTLLFVFYMLNKNSLLSLSALFLLLPSLMLPYFQNWYLPFIFLYVLIPQRKKELEVTMIWLIFMIAVLSFGGVSFNPLQILDNFKSMLKL